MLSFIFSVLGSLIFWAVFFLCSLIIGSTLLKHIAPCAWEAIKTGKMGMSKEWPSLKASAGLAVFAIIGVYLFWPIILVGVALWFVSKNILWPCLRKVILNSGNIIPDFELRKEYKDE